MNHKAMLNKYTIDAKAKHEEENPWWITLPFGKFIKNIKDEKQKKELEKKFTEQFANELSKTETLLKYCKVNDLKSSKQWAANKLPVQDQIELLYVAAVNLSTLNIKKMKEEHKIGVAKDRM